jgi:hypothetical protein
MAEAPELPRVRRRPQPQARLARLRLEAQIFRPRLVRQNLRFTPNQLQAIDAERRIADCRGVPSRAALIRALIDAGMAAICAFPPFPVDRGKRNRRAPTGRWVDFVRFDNQRLRINFELSRVCRQWNSSSSAFLSWVPDLNSSLASLITWERYACSNIALSMETL